MKKYVLGFAFNQDRDEVVLIKKKRPDWQKGKLNGIGGKLEENDKHYHDAIVREFKEETGVQTDINQWKLFASLVDKNKTYEVAVFKLFDDCIFDCKTITDEKVNIYDVDQDKYTDQSKWYQDFKFIENIATLIPMALDNGHFMSILIYNN